MNMRLLRQVVIGYPTRYHYMSILGLLLCELHMGSGLPPLGTRDTRSYEF